MAKNDWIWPVAGIAGVAGLYLLTNPQILALGKARSSWGGSGSGYKVGDDVTPPNLVIHTPQYGDVIYDSTFTVSCTIDNFEDRLSPVVRIWVDDPTAGSYNIDTVDIWTGNFSRTFPTSLLPVGKWSTIRVQVDDRANNTTFAELWVLNPVRVCAEGDMRNKLTCWDGSTKWEERCLHNEWVYNWPICPPRPSPTL